MSLNDTQKHIVDEFSIFEDWQCTRCKKDSSKIGNLIGESNFSFGAFFRDTNFFSKKMCNFRWN